ncbi:CDP-alcohol phosphatidyltransferase family protein [Desulfatirhabdium butyrativorans]|uniref:CDP-alcohol phosphatidyltransferase family protein n=1 Tax=Desulfatirhabdium butyrativorans TaxID=340467 RepID=UPI00041AD0AC|nr:CDP-alcohol phosphatidyltransferase family protein [Desulfatirhabdium butyrativorans]
MPSSRFSKKITALLVYGRPPLVFGGMLCALAVMWFHNPVVYTIGVVMLFVAMSFDLVDGWFAARFGSHATFAHLADRIMDKIVYAIIFPVVAAGMMWRLAYIMPGYDKNDLLHALFVLVICVTVLIRDSFAHFIRWFTMGKGPEPENSEFTRLRTVVAAPVAALLYANAFYIPEGPPSKLYFWISWLGNIPVKWLFVIEILFLVINFGSIAGYLRKYGSTFMNELCLGNERLRRKILAVLPNSLTIFNAVMGLLALWFAYQDRIRESYLLLIGAAVFDKLDGAVARRLGLTEPLPGVETQPRFTLGGILDDISDGISFCIVPAWIYSIVLADSGVALPAGISVDMVAWFYALAGVARLIYFTIDTRPIPGFFKGMPTPAGALFTASTVLMFSQYTADAPESAPFWGAFSTVVMVAGGVLMNLYPLRYLHVGKYMDQNAWFKRLSICMFGIAIISPYLGPICFLYLLGYVFSPLVTRRLLPGKTAKKPSMP